MNLFVAAGGFLACAAVIFFAGRGLSKYGERIAEITGWGGAWMGLILMAAVTSLPELVVGTSAAAVVGSADLTVGNIVGSCAFNLLILAGLDVFVPARKPIFSQASVSHVLAVALTIILLALVGVGLVNTSEMAITPWLGVTSLLFIVVYLGSVRLIFLYSLRTRPDPAVQPMLNGTSLPNQVAGTLPTGQVVIRFTLSALLVVAAATLLSPFADTIAQETGLAQSFVGTLFLATTTSLPELAVSLAAIRMGAIDLAVGNMLGSNLFNIFVLALNDFAYTQGFLLQDATDVHLVSVLATIVMSAIVIIGLTYHVPNKRFGYGWDAALILVIYLANMAFLFSA